MGVPQERQFTVSILLSLETICSSPHLGQVRFKPINAAIAATMAGIIFASFPGMPAVKIPEN